NASDVAGRSSSDTTAAIASRATFGVEPAARATNSGDTAARNAARAYAAWHAFVSCANNSRNAVHSSGEYKAGSNDDNSRHRSSARERRWDNPNSKKESRWFRGK